VINKSKSIEYRQNKASEVRHYGKEKITTKTLKMRKSILLGLLLTAIVGSMCSQTSSGLSIKKEDNIASVLHFKKEKKKKRSSQDRSRKKRICHRHY
jgi:hypothetical protein